MEGYGRKLEQPYGTLWKPLATPMNHFKAKTVNLERMDTQTDPCIELRYAQLIKIILLYKAVLSSSNH